MTKFEKISHPLPDLRPMQSFAEILHMILLERK
jgi:hypothetical protein